MIKYHTSDPRNPDGLSPTHRRKAVAFVFWSDRLSDCPAARIAGGCRMAHAFKLAECALVESASSQVPQSSVQGKSV